MIINGCGAVSPTPFSSHMRPQRPGTTHRVPFAPPLDPLMVPQHGGDQPRPGDSGRAAQPASATLRTNFDWLRTPPPPTLTPFQKFVRDVDWSATSLGLIEQWPRELKQLVRLMMGESDPCIAYWGPTCAIIYNEAYAPLVGSKHPAMMGQDARHAFPDFWSYFDKVISEQRLTGETVSGEASMLLMERHGFLEETYFDWTLVPVIGDDGDILASYGTPHDLTDHAITTRRTACIQHLTHLVTKTNTLPALWKATLAGLGDNHKDVPFALLYSVTRSPNGVTSSQSGNEKVLCTLEGTIGVERGHAAAQESLVLGPHAGGFARSLFEAVATGETVVLDASHPDLEKLMNGIEWEGYGAPSRHFAVIPVVVDEEATAFMIIGLNPYRCFDQSYREFLRYVTEVVGPHISKIRLAAEVKSGAEMAREAKLKFEKVDSRFHKFAERSVIGLAMADPDRNIVYANNAWYKLAGLKPGTWSYSSWLDTVIPEDRPLVEEWWARVLAEKSGGSFQFRCKEPFRRGHMSSDYRTIMCAVYADLNEAGEIESVMGLTIDISELKWTEEQLLIRTKEVEESNGKYRNYAEHCPLGIVRTDANGYVQYGNEAWHNFYGFKKGQVTVPHPWMPYLDDEHKEPWMEAFRSLTQEPGPVAREIMLKKTFAAEEGNESGEHNVWLLVTGFSDIDKDGRVNFIDFWVTDISAQKMAARVLSDKMDEAIRLKTHQERFIDMISHEIRNPLSAVLHCGEEVVEAMHKSLAETRRLSLSHAGGPPADDGHTKIRAHMSNALDAANTIMYCVQHQKQIVDDVLTLSKLDAELLVVSPIPVQPIALICSALKIFEPELKMTDTKLKITEDESLSQLAVRFILLDPNRFLQVVINLVTNAIKFTKTSEVRDIEITVSASSQPPPGEQLGVEYVPRRYSQSKAISPVNSPGEGHGRFDVPDDMVYLCFSVTDTGKGLTAPERLLLFNRFSQASPKTHIEYGGSGLGLFISRQITEMLGGQIGMSSTPGSGSKFSFYVKTPKVAAPRRHSVTVEPIVQMTRTLGLTTAAAPLVVAPDRKARDANPIDLKLVIPGSAEPKKRAVLVVEDNLVNQKVLCKLLRNRGFTVEAANHGEEALQLLGCSKQPDGAQDTSLYGKFEVILCDIEMPVMNGIAFVEELRRLEGSEVVWGHKPVIGVTANVRGKQVTAAIEAGMDGVTTKPYRIEELIAHIDRVCYAILDR